MEFLPGDIVLTRSKSWISRAIRRFSTTPGESMAQASHVAIVVEGGDARTARIVEALSSVQENPLWSYADEEVEIWRLNHLLPTERQRVADQAREYVRTAKGYGWLKIGAHLGDWLLSWPGALIGWRSPFVFRRVAGLEKYPICSWVVAWSFSVMRDGIYPRTPLGMFFGCTLRSVQPDDIEDDLIAEDGKHAYKLCGWGVLRSMIA